MAVPIPESWNSSSFSLNSFILSHSAPASGSQISAYYNCSLTGLPDSNLVSLTTTTTNLKSNHHSEMHISEDLLGSTSTRRSTAWQISFTSVHFWHTRPSVIWAMSALLTKFLPHLPYHCWTNDCSSSAQHSFIYLYRLVYLPIIHPPKLNTFFNI